MDGIFYFEIIGTIIFALQGSLVAVERKLDILGMIVLGVTTAVGGGMFRDLILGKTPPALFINPTYCLVAVITCGVFIVVYRYFVKLVGSKYYGYILKSMTVLDAIGLGIFTVVGANVSIGAGFGGNIFLCSFVGVMTGVGGGVLRDVLANRTPVILKKEIYAVASILGAVMYCYMLQGGISKLVSLYSSAAMIIIIRLIAVRRNIHLPTLALRPKDPSQHL
ncbi:MAG: trimeric intracellular cation channel family protein [Cellulosilyticaceae bacterium]